MAPKKENGSGRLSPWDRIKHRRCHRTLTPAQRVNDTLMRFRNLLHELPKDGVTEAIDYQAMDLIKKSPGFVAPNPNLIGNVPGVEVGDEFIYRTEPSIIGLHKPPRAEINYIKRQDEDGIICTSVVVASECGGNSYSKNKSADGSLIFCSNAGASTMGYKIPEDQKLEGGILALSNSKSAKNSVRVIRSNRQVGEGGKTNLIYIYDGLYEVSSFWTQKANTGKMVYMFKLVRKPGQPKLTGNKLTKL